MMEVKFNFQWRQFFGVAEGLGFSYAFLVIEGYFCTNNRLNRFGYLTALNSYIGLTGCTIRKI